MIGASLLSSPVDARRRDADPPRTPAIPEPKGEAAAVDGADLVARALQEVPVGVCKETLEQELRAGRRSGPLCAMQRDRVLAALAKLEPRAAFGVVVQHRSTPQGATLILALARRCKRWPLQHPDRTVLNVADLQGARCHVERFSGPLSITARGRDGLRHEAIVDVIVSAEGHAVIDYAALDDAFKRLGFSGLDAFERLELGPGAWAGELDLARLRTALADAHFSWIARGRGVPALFAVRHPGHARVDEARAWAVEARLERERQDYRAVTRGDLAIQEFLERHPTSGLIEATHVRGLEASAGSVGDASSVAAPRPAPSAGAP